MSQDHKRTVDAEASNSPAGERIVVIVSYQLGAEARSLVVEVTEGVPITIGRSRDRTITIDDDRVSRSHVQISRRGGEIYVEDLGSRNGTLLDHVRISGRTRLDIGSGFVVGPATCFLARTAAIVSQPRVTGIAELDDRLAAEVDRSQRFRRSLSLIMLGLDGAGRDDRVIDAVARQVRKMDTLAEYGPGELALLVPEADLEAAMVAARRLVELVAMQAPTARAFAGVAALPGAGRSAGELLAAARSALRDARRGPSPVVGMARAPAIRHEREAIVIDPQMRHVYELIERVAPTPVTVLLLGETGVGKEVVAERLHQRGRGGKPFVKLNCASLPETLIERELFGHERGAFTGADRRQAGYFEAADGGTIFLDEIGEAPLSVQAKLLRVLEARTFTRVGGTEEQHVDVRIICATNRDLEVDVRASRFREDLFYRLSAFTVLIPPLRNRRSEIRPLAEQFATEFAHDLKIATPAFTPEAVALLESHGWPGNVRELRNTVERALVLHADGVIRVEDLDDRLRSEAVATDTAAIVLGGEDVRRQLGDIEREALVAALDATGGNQSRAARLLGMSRRSLLYRMEKYAIKPKG